MKYDKLIIYADGGARGNPGPAGIGVVIMNEQKKVVDQVSKYIGEATNNQAEYQALILAMQKAKELGAKELEIFLDSELLVKQINRQYRVKDKDLALLFVKVYNAVLGFNKVIFRHIRRELNLEADKLVNLAIDRGV